MLYPGFQWGAASPQNAIGDPLITMARRNRPLQIIPPQLEYNHTVKRGCNVGYYIFKTKQLKDLSYMYLRMIQSTLFMILVHF